MYGACVAYSSELKRAVWRSCGQVSVMLCTDSELSKVFLPPQHTQIVCATLVLIFLLSQSAIDRPPTSGKGEQKGEKGTQDCRLGSVQISFSVDPCGSIITISQAPCKVAPCLSTERQKFGSQPSTSLPTSSAVSNSTSSMLLACANQPGTLPTSPPLCL